MRDYLDRSTGRKRARLARQIILEFVTWAAGAAIVLWLFAP
jgi:hypothetical protein